MADPRGHGIKRLTRKWYVQPAHREAPHVDPVEYGWLAVGNHYELNGYKLEWRINCWSLTYPQPINRASGEMVTDRTLAKVTDEILGRGEATTMEEYGLVGTR